MSSSLGASGELRFPRQTIFYADIRALVSVSSFVDRGPVTLSRLGDCPEVVGWPLFRVALNENSRVDL